MAENWGVSSRLAIAGYALAATVPVWPIVQSGEPIADEMLAPAEVLAIVPVVLLFPAAWALLGRTRRGGRLFGLALAQLVLLWALWTSSFGEYGTPPDVDDGLRWYLLTAGAVVVTGVVTEFRRREYRLDLRWAVGVVCWATGIGVTAAVPVLDGSPTPPDDAVLPLPPTMALVADETDCDPVGHFCSRRFVVTSTGHAQTRDLARQLGEHLEHTKGWQAQWYEFTPAPGFECRPSARLADPYDLCADLRIVDEQRPAVEVRLGYANEHDPIY